MPKQRKAGVLLHISSLPGKDAVGTVSDGIPFLKLLKRSGLQSWQILPIGPTIIGDSPFQGPSAFAGNPNLINLEQLVKAGDLSRAALQRYYSRYDIFLKRQGDCAESRAHFEFLWLHKVGFDRKSWGFKNGPLRQAFGGFLRKGDHKRRAEFNRFIRRTADTWLNDYAFFMALKAFYGFPKQWSAWDKIDRYRQAGYGSQVTQEDLLFYKYIQFVFDQQMRSLRDAAKRAEVEIIGDIPMYPAYDSADVWANPDLFQLDHDLKVTHVACVPPDNFNPKGGQLWGNPLYRWGVVGSAAQQKQVFAWWEKRLARLFEYHDYIKIDHFRGFIAYGRVAAGDKDARKAKWTAGPGTKLFLYLKRRRARLNIIAEDLGVITTPVKSALNELGFPGMRLLQFANFNTGKSIHFPDSAPENAVVYTGTHDNPTLLQWYIDFCDQSYRKKIDAYLARHSNEPGFTWKSIDLVFKSSAERAIIPMQDYLELGGQARMNFPSRIGYWRWRMSNQEFSQFSRFTTPRLGRLIRESRRG